MQNLKPAALASVRLADVFFAPRQRANRAVTIPACLKMCVETGRIAAFNLSWKPGEANQPHIFWDSDVAKVMEGMAHELALSPDPALAARLDGLVETVVSAQQPDGYLNTHFTVIEPERRWKNLHHDHELYCAGHLIEAAVAHRAATGGTKFLDAMRRYADLIARVFGRGEGQIRGYPGHEEIELALFKLADATGEEKYARLAEYFIEERGQEPNYFAETEGMPRHELSNVQAHEPVRAQTQAAGHAVRAVYLYSAMADLAVRKNDAQMLDACRALFENIARRRSFVTGGIGQQAHGERFDDDYKLQNHGAYAESCAAIGLALFCQRMHAATGGHEFIAMAERALYNAVFAGINLRGDRFFYQNPLAVNKRSQYARERSEWFWCSCCPTSFARFTPQLGSFVWSRGADGVSLNIPAASVYDDGGIALEVESDYPYGGRVKVRALKGRNVRFQLLAPDFSRGGMERTAMRRTLSAGETAEFEIAMPVRVIRPHPEIDDCAGRIALARGPLVYAFESAENCPNLNALIIPAEQEFSSIPAQGLPDGTHAITGKAFIEEYPADAADDLYTARRPVLRETRFTAIPYALWQNRSATDMTVWVRAM